MSDAEYAALRKSQIVEFRNAVGEAIAQAERERSSAPIWSALRGFGHDHVVDFGDVRLALNIAAAYDRGGRS